MKPTNKLEEKIMARDNAIRDLQQRYSLALADVNTSPLLSGVDMARTKMYLLESMKKDIESVYQSFTPTILQILYNKLAKNYII